MERFLLFENDVLELYRRWETSNFRIKNHPERLSFGVIAI